MRGSPMFVARTLALAVLVGAGIGLPEACNKARSLLHPPDPAASADDGTTLSSAQPAVVPPEEQAIAEAKRLCLQQGDCQTAHERLTITIPEASSMRQRADYRDIEARWAATTINDAFNDPDVAARRHLLEEVIASPDVDATARDRAKQTLAKLPAAPAGSGSAAGTAGSATNGDGALPTDLDRAKKLAASKDLKGARDLLLPKAKDGSATKAERDLLLSICRRLGDKSCQAAAKK